MYPLISRITVGLWITIICLLLGCAEGSQGLSNLDETMGTIADSSSATDTSQTCGDTVCDDKNPCTENLCVDGECSYEISTGSPCDDGNACTQNDICGDSGTCEAGTTLDCSGVKVCTMGHCDPDKGECIYENLPDESPCADALNPCGDGAVCTQETCICVGGEAQCNSEPAEDGTACDFNINDCTAGDACLAGQCLPGDPLPLDDNNPCTMDLCIKGEIEHTPLLEGQCDDGNQCTSDDSCFQGSCVGGSQVQCLKRACSSSVSCDPTEGCIDIWLPEGAICDDNDSCTTDDICTEDHSCIGTPTGDCDDQNPCTLDGCTDGGCTHEPISVLCDDGNPNTCDDLCTNGSCIGIPCETVDPPEPEYMCDSAIEIQSGELFSGDLCAQEDLGPTPWCNMQGKDMVLKIWKGNTGGNIAITMPTTFEGLVLNFRGFESSVCSNAGEFYCWDDEYFGGSSSSNVGYGGPDIQNLDYIYLLVSTDNGNCGPFSLKATITSNP